MYQQVKLYLSLRTQTQNGPNICNMHQALKLFLNKGMSIYENDDLFIIAAISDPRFKRKFRCNPDKAITLTETLTLEASKYKKNVESSEPPSKSFTTELEDNNSLFSLDMTPTAKQWK